MATYTVSQGVPYEQQPPPAYQSQPAYNPAYSQSQGVPYNAGYQPQGYYQQPQPVTHVHTTYVQRPAGGGTDAGDALCCGLCLGCLLCCLSDSCK